MEVSSLLGLLSSPSPLSLSLSLYLHTCYCHRRDPSVSLSLRCYRLSFSVTTARSHRPLVWAGLGWFGQFPLQHLNGSRELSTWWWACPKVDIYTLSVVTAPGSGHWLTLGLKTVYYEASSIPTPKWWADWGNQDQYQSSGSDVTSSSHYQNCLDWLAQSLNDSPTHFVSLSISALSHYSSLIPDHVLPIWRLSTDVQKVQTNQCRYQRR